MESDIEAVVRLMNSAYRGEASKKGWTTEANLLKGELRIDEPTLKASLQEPGAVMLTCKDENNELVGCVYLQQQDTQLYLGMLTVSPEKQAQGIGKQLLFAAEEFARQVGCTSIVMTVIDKRHELIAWYQRHGYLPTGEKKPFPDDSKFGVPTEPFQFIILQKYII